MHYPSAPVGVYDSGLGGLSVVKALRAHLPNESIVYVADNARVPYGGRSPEEIRRFSQEVIDFLVEQGVKTIVCACNTSSVLILPALKRYRGVTVLGLARAGAVLPPEVKRVGLLATEATVRSQQYKQMLRLHHPFVAYEEQACPAFVPLIESGHWEGPEAEAAVQAYVAPLLQKKVDALLLGCSHYPYLAPLLTRMAPHIRLINPAEQMAHMLAQTLREQRLEAPAQARTFAHFYTTGPSESFRTLGERFLGFAMETLRSTSLNGAVTAPARPAPSARVEAALSLA
jgi:glutamate racemase